MRRSLLLVAAVLLIPVLGRAQDSTAKPAGHTLFGAMGIKGMQISTGSGLLPYQTGRSSRTAGLFELGVTFKALPAWTFVILNEWVTATDSTDYVPAGSANNYHPQLTSQSNGIEVQRRWSPIRVLHPIVTAGLGRETAYFGYSRCISGTCTGHTDDRSAVTYGETAAGGELNLWSWMRLSATLGYRGAGNHPIAELHGTNSGTTFMLLMEFGKF